MQASHVHLVVVILLIASTFVACNNNAFITWFGSQLNAMPGFPSVAARQFQASVNMVAMAASDTLLQRLLKSLQEVYTSFQDKLPLYKVRCWVRFWVPGWVGG
jgi:hypothetical protein